MEHQAKPTTISKIFELRDQYFNLREDIDHDPDAELDRNYLQQLMDIRKNLSCLTMDLARETGKYLRDFKLSKGGYEAAKFKEQGNLMTSGEKVTKAEAMAKIATSEKNKELYTKEAIYASAKLILDQANELLFSVKQDISIIRNDYNSLSDRD